MFCTQGDGDVVSSDDSAYEDEMAKSRRGTLGRLTRLKLEAMLRSLGNTRDKIARVMVFALDRPDAAEEVVEVLIQSLLIGTTPVPRKVARLHIISDILHNCAGTPTNAWKYRSLFEARLPEVFTHMGEIYKSFPGRMKAEIFRKQIMSVVQVWENWLVFTPTVLADLEKRLSTSDESSEAPREHSESEQPDTAEATEKKGTPPTFRALPKKAGFSAIKTGVTDEMHAVEEPDLDGEEILSRPVEHDDDVDGEPMDGEDIDGAPL